MLTLSCKLFFFTFFLTSLFAQNKFTPFSFPHTKGDLWEYRFTEFGDPFSFFDTIQTFTIFDTTYSNGVIHLVNYSREIDPIKPPYVLSDTIKYWIDTASHHVYGQSWRGDDSVLIYKLDAVTGEQWVTFKMLNQFEMARVVDKWDGTVLGKSTRLMRIRYYGAQDSTDTLGLDRYTDIVSSDFGLVSRRGIESTTQEINLRGAVINGLFYGDTTLLSIINHTDISRKSFTLFQNYPNPFNPSTTIHYALPQPGVVRLTVYDLVGREVTTLVNEQKEAGHYTVDFNGEGLASGMYLYRLSVGPYTQIKRMMLAK